MLGNLCTGKCMYTYYFAVSYANIILKHRESAGRIIRICFVLLQVRVSISGVLDSPAMAVGVDAASQATF